MTRDLAGDAWIQQALEDHFQEHPGAYGYSGRIETIRDKEYPQLASSKLTYLDHAASTLCCTTLLGAVQSKLNQTVLSNPHSSVESAQKVHDVRQQCLKTLFNASTEDFEIVFCANATAALKLVGECFDGSVDYFYHEQSHTSLVGLRGLAKSSMCWSSAEDIPTTSGDIGVCAFPAQSNFNGERLYCKDIILKARQSGQLALVDAASRLSTKAMDFSDFGSAPDFTVCSFYKIFGLPEMGALVVRKSPETMQFLKRKRYFGGGSVEALSVLHEAFHVHKADSLAAALEDGTTPFLGVQMLASAFESFQSVYGVDYLRNVQQHTTFLTDLLRKVLSGLRHTNGRKLVRFYDNRSYEDGPILAFNMFDESGEYIGYSTVASLASLENISFRTGTMCNPGATQKYLDYGPGRIQSNYNAGVKCGDGTDHYLDADGRAMPTGVIRVSLGAMSTVEDVIRFARFCQIYFLRNAAPSAQSVGRMEGTVSQLIVYPVKSCAGYQVPKFRRWPLLQTGLLFDRHFFIIRLDDSRNQALSQKQYQQLALVRPDIDLEKELLHLQYTVDGSRVSLSLTQNGYESMNLGKEARVCEDQVNVLCLSDKKVIRFFSGVLGFPCTLATLPDSASLSRHFKGSTTPRFVQEEYKVRFTNESPLLLVNEASVQQLNDWILLDDGVLVDWLVFRANILFVAGDKGTAFSEDFFENVECPPSDVSMQVLAPCRRCHMITVDPKTGQRNPSAFKTLMTKRRNEVDKKIYFGIHLAPRSTGTLGVGDTLYFHK